MSNLLVRILIFMWDKEIINAMIFEVWSAPRQKKKKKKKKRKNKRKSQTFMGGPTQNPEDRIYIYIYIYIYMIKIPQKLYYHGLSLNNSL